MALSRIRDLMSTGAMVVAAIGLGLAVAQYIRLQHTKLEVADKEIEIQTMANSLALKDVSIAGLEETLASNKTTIALLEQQQLSDMQVVQLLQKEKATATRRANEFRKRLKELQSNDQDLQELLATTLSPAYVELLNGQATDHAGAGVHPERQASPGDARGGGSSDMSTLSAVQSDERDTYTF